MMPLRFSLPLTFTLFTLAACGSQVTTSTGGGAGSGGGAGNSTTSGTGGSSGQCPAAAPAFGAPCSTQGLSCSYGGGCCPDTYFCDGSVWQALATGCAPPVGCPETMPAAGAPCDVCFEPGPCTYPCSDPSSAVTATCNNGSWQMNGVCPVPLPVDCNGTVCDFGLVCLKIASGVGFSYSCEPDPCAPSPLSCACADKLCGGPPLGCNIPTPGMVECGCATCP